MISVEYLYEILPLCPLVNAKRRLLTFVSLRFPSLETGIFLFVH